jgi:hypothetical protein
VQRSRAVHLLSFVVLAPSANKGAWPNCDHLRSATTRNVSIELMKRLNYDIVLFNNSKESRA